MKMFSEGAESRVFETSLFGKEVLVKLRHAKRYRISEIDENLRRTRTRKEARAMQKAAEAHVRVPVLLGLGRFSIYMEKIGGKLLKDIRNQRADYREIGGLLARLHSSGIVHGDFTPANIIVNRQGAWVIDFGLSDISDSTEDRALDLLLMKRAVDRKQYAALEYAYSKEFREAKQVLARLADIERRGRYQIRTLT